ncbi:hypothetical protein [Acinetobacter sp. NBRC 100985]|uniref:hypothetical protein n=1 Tax=Acinetobacter sp. NBRC 100985 TaxID=1071390 RepID=UPI000235E8E8|nr:hypothetical protein [Acinetobacter sp. NBRC 100985]GAB01778.1 hypothetical protein ACT4_022_00430 [Acinetobacter sp. NBRC 100985]
MGNRFFSIDIFFQEKKFFLENIEEIIDLFDEKFMIEPHKKINDESSGKEIYVIRCSDNKYLHVILYKNRLDFEFADTSSDKIDIYKIKIAFEEFISLISVVFNKVNNLDIVRLGVGVDTIYVADSIEESTSALKKIF